VKIEMTKSEQEKIRAEIKEIRAKIEAAHSAIAAMEKELEALRGLQRGRRAALDSAPVGAGTATSPRGRGHAGVGVYVPDELRVGQRENRDWVLLSGPTRNAFVWTRGGVDAPALDCPAMTEQFSVQDINAPDGRLGDRYHAWQKPDDLRSVLFVTARSRAGCGSGSVRRNREFLIGSGAAWA
jgi:hypothetical protein